MAIDGGIRMQHLRFGNANQRAETKKIETRLIEHLKDEGIPADDFHTAATDGSVGFVFKSDVSLMKAVFAFKKLSSQESQLDSGQHTFRIGNTNVYVERSIPHN